MKLNFLSSVLFDRSMSTTSDTLSVSASATAAFLDLTLGGDGGRRHLKHLNMWSRDIAEVVVP